MLRTTGETDLSRAGLPPQHAWLSSIGEEARGLDRAPARPMNATALDRLLGGARQVIGKRPRGRTVGAGVAPEFMPKRSCAPIGNGARTGDDASSLEIAEWEGPDPAGAGWLYTYSAPSQSPRRSEACPRPHHTHALRRRYSQVALKMLVCPWGRPRSRSV